MDGELVTVPRPAIIEAGGDEWWGMPASLHRSALRTHALATRCCVRTVSRSSGSRRTDSTVAGDEPKAGRLSRRHTSSSTSYPRTASSAMAPDISSAIGVPSALAPCVVFIRSDLVRKYGGIRGSTVVSRARQRTERVMAEFRGFGQIQKGPVQGAWITASSPTGQIGPSCLLDCAAAQSLGLVHGRVRLEGQCFVGDRRR